MRRPRGPSAQADEVDDRTPLLHRSTNDAHAAGGPAPTPTKAALPSAFKEILPLLPMYAFLLFTYLVSSGPVSYIVGSIRAYACADFFDSHPDWLPPTLDGGFSTLPPTISSMPDHPCSAAEIEVRVSTWISILNASEKITAALAVSLVYGGFLPFCRRRRMILFTVLSSFVSVPLAFLSLPKWYPFGPIYRTRDEILSGTVPQLSWGSPRFNLLALLIFMVLAGLLGSDSIGYAICRSLIVERSNPANRSRHLAGAQLALMLGLVVGPTGFSWIAERWPSDARQIRGLFQLVYRLFGKMLPAKQFHDKPIAAAVVDGSFTNRTAFFCALACVAMQLLIALIFIPDTRPSTASAPEEESRTAAQDPQRNRKGSTISALSVLKPFRNLRTGQLDTRLLRLTLIAALNFFGMLGYGSLITYLSYAEISPLAISYMLSWIGFTRIGVLSLGFPLAVAFAGKLIRKPAVLAQLSAGQLEDLTSRSTALETPGPDLVDDNCGDAEEEQYGLRSTSTEARQGRTSSAEASRLSVIFDEDARKTMLKALALWRTKIDLALLRTSLIVDFVGWSAQTFAISLLSLPLIVTAQTFMSLGSASQPLIESVAVTIVEEVKAEAISQEVDRIEAERVESGEEEDEEIARAAAASVERIYNVESIIACFGVVQAVIDGSAFLLYSALYYEALGWRMPALTFVLAVACFFIASLVSATVRP